MYSIQKINIAVNMKRGTAEKTSLLYLPEFYDLSQKIEMYFRHEYFTIWECYSSKKDQKKTVRLPVFYPILLEFYIWGNMKSEKKKLAYMSVCFDLEVYESCFGFIIMLKEIGLALCVAFIDGYRPSSVCCSYFCWRIKA